MLELNCVDCGRPSDTYLCKTCESMKDFGLSYEEKRPTNYMSEIVSAELESSNIERFVLGGNAIFTLHNTLKNTHLTYKVRVCVGDPNLFFVSVLTGPDNWANYSYIGTIRDGVYWHGKKSRIACDAVSSKTFQWFWNNLGRLPQALKVLHEGKCGKCGRKLTDPESISSGFGPICRESLS